MGGAHVGPVQAVSCSARVPCARLLLLLCGGGCVLALVLHAHIVCVCVCVTRLFSYVHLS